MSDPQQYCLRWNNHQPNLQRMFMRLLRSQTFTDVTLACEGRSLQAHKLMLSACSAYFEQLFAAHPDKAPLVILKDVKYNDMKAIVDFMYVGEINVAQDQLSSLLSTALALQVKGLADVSSDGTKDGATAAADTPQPSRTASPSPRAAPTSARQSGDAGSLSDGAAAEDKPLRSSPSPSHSVSPEAAPPVETMLKVNSLVANADHLQTVKGLLSGVLKLDDYVASNGGRDGFWQSAGVVRVMAAIRERLIDLKTGAELLGVPYSTIYGRYREHHQPVTTAADSGDCATLGSPTKISLGFNSAAATAAAAAVNAEMADSGIIYPVVQLGEHVQAGGLRHAFWELPSTRSVLDAIFGRQLEMKTGAEMLGVSYGTLYGRYRENYGYLKANASSAKQSGKRNSVGSGGTGSTTSGSGGGGGGGGMCFTGGMWEDSATADTLARVTSGQLSVQQAAELLGIDYYVLKYQLALMEAAAVTAAATASTTAAATAAASAPPPPPVESDSEPEHKRPRTEHTNGATDQQDAVEPQQQ